MATSVSRRLNILYMYTFRDFLLQMGRHGRIIWLLDLQLAVQSLLITANAVSSNPTQARCIRYTIM